MVGRSCFLLRSHNHQVLIQLLPLIGSRVRDAGAFMLKSAATAPQVRGGGLPLLGRWMG